MLDLGHLSKVLVLPSCWMAEEGGSSPLQACLPAGRPMHSSVLVWVGYQFPPSQGMLHSHSQPTSQSHSDHAYLTLLRPRLALST